MRRAAVAVIAVMACLFAAPVWAGQGPYPPPSQGSAEVSPSRIAAGECTAFSGSGFALGSTVSIADDGESRGTAPVDADGRFRTQVCFAVDARVGVHDLSASGQRSDDSALTVSASVTVTGLEQSAAGGNGLGFGSDTGGSNSANSGAGDSGAFGSLARTGVPLSIIMTAALVLLAVGSALLLAAERRHRRRHGRPRTA